MTARRDGCQRAAPSSSARRERGDTRRATPPRWTKLFTTGHACTMHVHGSGGSGSGRRDWFFYPVKLSTSGTHTHDTTHRGGVVGSSSRVEIVFNLNPATPGRRRADLVVCTAPTCGGQLLPRSRTAFHHEWQMKSLYSVAEPETEIEFSPGVVTYRGDWKIRMHRSISRRAVVAIATRPRHQHQACKLNR